MRFVRLPEIGLDVVVDLVDRVHFQQKADEGLSWWGGGVVRKRERKGEARKSTKDEQVLYK